MYNTGENGEVFDFSPYGSPSCSPKGHSREAGQLSPSRPRGQSVTGMAKRDSRAVPSGKVYRQLFDAQVQLSRSLLATYKDQSVQSNTQCSTASSEKEHVDTDDSEDVSGLPDTLVTSGSSSDVIERMSMKKAAKHQETLLQLDTELTAISKQNTSYGMADANTEFQKVLRSGLLTQSPEEIFSSHVRENSEELLTSLQEVDLILDKLSHQMERTEELMSHSLQDVNCLWGEVEEKVKVKRSRIMEFYTNLSQTETQRTIQIRAVLKIHGGKMEKISFLPLSDIQRLLHSKATILNESLLANRRSLCQLRLRLLVENLQGASVLHQHWENCVEQWRNSRIQQIVQHFSEFCSKDLDEELFSEQPEILKTNQSLREMSVRRREMVSSMSSLAPPNCTSVLASDWFAQLKSYNHQIDGLHSDLVKCIHNCYDQIWQKRLEEVHRCENTLRDLQLSEAQVTNMVQSSFLPLIGQSQSKADERLAAFHVNCDSVSRHSLSISWSVFGIMHRASFIWEEHCSNLKNIETKVQRDVMELRQLQTEQLKTKTLHLDDKLSILRQESNEETLNISLEKALLELHELSYSCRQHLLDQNTVMDRLPVLYLLELQNYSSRLSAFFHLSSIYTPSLDDFGPAFSDLDSSLKATLTLAKENKENTDAAQYQDDSELLGLCNMNSSEEFSSSRGITYRGPPFTCQSPELKAPLGNRQLEVFPVVLLSQTLSRMRSMYVEHMEQHFHDSVLSALSLLSHLRQEALIERDVKLQQLSAQHVQQRIFKPRLAELQRHVKQVDNHCETVSHTLSSIKTDLKGLLESVGKRNQTFSTTLSSLESSLRSVDSLQRLETLSSILKDYLENHMADTRIAQTSLRKNVQAQLEQLKKATTQLLCSFRLFSEGGDFTPYEIKMFQKRLKKEMKNINVEEESIFHQLEACLSSSLQQVREVYSLQEKMTSLKSEFMFVEKTQNILRTTQVKIKAVAATCNQQQSDTSSRICELEILLEDKGAQVCQAQVLATLSVLSQMLNQQAQCLHTTLVPKQHPLQDDTHLSAHLSSSSSALQPYGSVGGLHHDPLLGLIKSLNRDRTPASTEKEPRGEEGQSAGPIQRREECPTVRRGGRPLRFDWRIQIFGPRPEPEQDTLSFSSKVNGLLWKASEVLILTAEDFYRSSYGVTQFLLVPDNLEQWVDNMQKRLLGYLEQAKSFLNSSKKEFVNHLSSIRQVCQKLPELLHLHENQQQQKLLAEMDRFRQTLDQTMAKSETEKSDIMGQLRLCISGEALQTLLLREQHRQQALSSAINSSARAQKECLQLAGEDFVTSLASLTEQLLSLLDLLMTVDEEKAATQNSEKTALRPHTGKRTWQGIPYFPLSVVTKATASITTNKCTREHELVIQERDATVKRFGEMYRSELLRLDSDNLMRLGEVEKWSVHWSQQLHTFTSTTRPLN